MKTNKELIINLKLKENIPKLEFLLDQKFDPKLEKKIDVVKEVNNYLRTNENVPFIKTNHSHSTYDLQNQIIKLKKDSTMLDFAHEYTHYINHKIRGINSDYLYCEEGIARGVETHIANLVGGKIQLDIHLLNSLEYLLVYLRLCHKLNQKPKKKYGELDITGKTIPPHALGNSILSLYKLEYGDDIYWKLLHGKFKKSFKKDFFSIKGLIKKLISK